ncbi:MAG: site-2 protease family protein [Planctomycetes bacterium]|nr:site-2 protease family protein [Planctomycetota bacterium]
MSAMMMKSHSLGRIKGIEIRIAYFLYLFIAAVIAAHAVAGSNTQKKTGIIAALLLYPFFSLLHELAHSLFAMRHGVKVNRIILHPIGGAAELQGYLPGPGAELQIALAGPLANILLAAAFSPLMILEGSYNPLLALSSTNTQLGVIASVAVMINLAIGILNLLPIFPMDGGRVATAVSVAIFGQQRGVALINKVALLGVGALIACGITVAINYNLRAGLAVALMGTFLYSTGKQELQARMFASRYISHNPSLEAKPETAAPAEPETLQAEIPESDDSSDTPDE